MKKVSLLVLILFLSLLVGCNVHGGKGGNAKVIMPTGTPSLSLGDFVLNHDEDVDVEIVMGSEPLQAAFTNAEYDIIVAPVNLGAKFYNSIENFQYRLYRPIVGGNYYILSTEFTSFEELDGQEITVFGANSTPDVVFRALCTYYNIDPIENYVSDVNSANSSLIAGEAKTIITAEPSKTNVLTKGDYNVIDLQELWREMSANDYDVTQAGIFVKKGMNEDKLNKLLEQMENSIDLASSDPATLVERAMKGDANFGKFQPSVLTEALGNCNILAGGSNYRADIEYYFNMLIDLGLGKSIGNKLPDDEFYEYK
jgi:NitT/TauT family transport system substrate-binding protein